MSENGTNLGLKSQAKGFVLKLIFLIYDEIKHSNESLDISSAFIIFVYVYFVDV